MLKDFSSSLRPAVVLTLLFAALLGLAYPAVMTGIGQMLFPSQADGSLIIRGGKVVGSEIIGQSFAAPGYFHGRPSAAGKGYDATNSSGSNLGPASKALSDRVKGDVAALKLSPGVSLPSDLVTTSASGLDPHISPEAAYFQVSGVAKARGLDEAAVHNLVAANVERPLLGFIGESRVNVLELNLALDSLVQGGGARK